MNWHFEQRVDLLQPARTLFYTEPLMVEGDNLAHEWRVHVYMDGHPMDLTGYTITGYFDRSDGKMIPVTGTAEGSLAAVVLPQSVYVAAGPLSGLLRAGKDGQIITLAAGRWNVRRGPGDEIVDPGHVVPSLEELLAKIGEMEEKTNAANAAAAAANDAAASVDAKVENAVAPLKDDVSQLSESITELDRIKSPSFYAEDLGNLYNLKTDTYGYYINPKDGSLSETAGYYVTDYIEVTPFRTLFKSYNGYGAFYDGNKNFLLSNGYDVLSTVVPIGAKYYRTAFPTAKRTTAYVSYKDEYSKYGEGVHFEITNKLFTKWLNQHYLSAVPKEYVGKKIAVLGDSWSDTANNTCTKRWHDWIGEITGATVQCVAKSGAGYKKGTDDGNTQNRFIEQALTIDTDTDLAIIFGSGNDCGTGQHANFDFGTEKDKTDATLGGAMNITLDNIQQTAPNAKIIMVSSAPWISFDPYWSDGGRMGLHTALMEKVAKARCVEYLDMLHASDMHAQNKSFKAIYYNSDGVHPNDNGQKRLYPKILYAIKSVLPVS